MLDVVRRSGVVPVLERKLQSRPGTEPVLTDETLLLGVLLAECEFRSVRASDVCAVLAGLHPVVRSKVGLPPTGSPCTYRNVARRLRLLVKSLVPGWRDEQTGQHWDLELVGSQLLAASFPMVAARGIEACALLRVDRPEFGRGSPLRTEASGLHGQLQHRGYAATVAVATPRATWRGDADRPGKPKTHTPHYILAVSADPASRRPGPIGFEAVQRAKRVAPRISEVVADPPYTLDGPRFNRPLHAQGVNVFMKPPPSAIGRVPMVTISGRSVHHHHLLIIDGTIFPQWMPKDLWAPPQHLTGPQLTAWFGRRAKYRYVPVCKVRDSGGRVRAIRFKCPVCAGRLAGMSGIAGARAIPAAGPGHGRPCCPGTVQVPIGQMDSYQTIPFGTAAFNAAYAARNRAENAHQRLRECLGQFHRGTGREPDGARCTMALVAAAVGHNIRLAARQRVPGQIARRASDKDARFPYSARPTRPLSPGSAPHSVEPDTEEPGA